MKRLFAAALLALSSIAFGATTTPIQLLNPVGSTAGQAIVSTGASTAPAWGTAALAPIGANTVLGNAGTSSAIPSAVAVTNCVGTSSALVYTAGSGFGCNTTINATTLGGATFSAPGPIGSVSTSTGAFSSISTPSATIGGGTINNTSIGATAQSTGSFTTLAASSTVSGTGFSTYLASPPAIGGTAAAAGAFTTLSASSTVSGTGFSTYLASPPAIGGTAAAAGSFTTLNASGNDALLYQTSNALSVPTGTPTTVTTWTKISDRVNANFNASTGVFTAPVTGQYQVSAQLVFASAAGVVSTNVTANIVANGVTIAAGQAWEQSTSSTPMSVNVSAIASLTAGQTIVLQALQNSGATRSLSGVAGANFLSINRLP